MERVKSHKFLSFSQNNGTSGNFKATKKHRIRDKRGLRVSYTQNTDCRTTFEVSGREEVEDFEKANQIKLVDGFFLYFTRKMK
jgi:hypothetical protein